MNRALTCCFVAAASIGCDGPQRLLGPKGPGSAALASHTWVLLAGTILPALLTLALLAFAVWRGRKNREARLTFQQEERAVVFGAVAVAAVLLILLVSSFRTGRETVEPRSEPALTIEVIGHQFWWEVRYPDLGIVDANELHLPAGVPVRLLLSSSDVIHSFWVPELHGKRDMIPGRIERHWIQADAPGAFRGQCAEFCGEQHALMSFWVYAKSQGDFAAWAKARRARTPADAQASVARGKAVFAQAKCAACHVVAGQYPRDVTGAVGPDLTHFASRERIAAATLLNTRENLRSWLRDPARHKPGVRMPATALDDETLDALVDYLFSLR